MNVDEFRRRYRLAKKLKGLTYKQLARKSGFSPKYLERLATGDRYNPTVNLVECLAQALGVSPAWLVGWSNDASNPYKLSAPESSSSRGLQRTSIL